MITYRQAKKEDLMLCASILTHSFHGYSFFEMFVKDKNRRFQFLKAILEVGVKTGFKRHTILVAVQEAEFVAVAQLEAPWDKETSLWDYVVAGGIKVFCIGGIKNTFGWLKMNTEASARCHNLPLKPWYLSSLAVSNSYQGQGIGSKMLNECIIPYIAKHGGGVLSLITNAESNRNFYKKNGFLEFHETTICRNNKEIGNWSYKLEILPDNK